MAETTTVSRVIPARAERIFKAWLDAEEHAKMTGSGATAGPDGTFTAWDGYIKGKTIESTAPSRIVQRWRTTEFPEGAEDSTLTVTLEDLGDEGTKVTLAQSGMPEGQSDDYADGWEKFYFDPMTKYFSSTGSKLREMGTAIEEAVEEAVEDAVEMTSKAVEHAFEEAKEELGATAKHAMKSAEAQAKKAVKAVKKVQKSAIAKAKAVGQEMGKLLASKRKTAATGPAVKTAAKPAAKTTAKTTARPAGKMTAKPAAKKAAPSRAAPKKFASKKAAAPKKATPKKTVAKKAATSPKARVASRRR